MNASLYCLSEVRFRFIPRRRSAPSSSARSSRLASPASLRLLPLVALVVVGAAQAAAPDDATGQPLEAVQALRQQLAVQQIRITELQRLQAETERERQRLAAELDALRLKASQGAELSEQLATLRLLTDRLARVLPGDAAESQASGRTSDDASQTGEQRVAELADVRQRLAALTDAYANAQQARQSAEADAAAASARAAELEARLQQQQLTLTEAQLRADKAEKLHAALEDARARLLTENEKLKVELENARVRQADALERAVRLDARLAAAEARAGQVTDQPVQVPADGQQVRPGFGAASVPGAADNPGSEPMALTAVQPVVYRVREDDSLSKISVRFYGNSADWERIFAANRDVLEAPDKLAPGMQLIIP
jgi:nucleoid-associated protein YgaU